MKRVLLLLLLAVAHCGFAMDLVTPSGKLQGALSSRATDIAVFKGIPYAIAPIGARRWTYAEAHPGWQGVRNAGRFSPACAQHPYPEGSFFARSSEPTSEDCLYLNVWSSLPEGEALPVMVWIHGGALTRGSGSAATYDGTELAKKGVVLVTINYRLGVFGYMAHPELSAEVRSNSSGNYGTSDQIQALRWVKENIAAFGGDPENVTIFGESAGAWSVNHLVGSPEAEGLFHRAIGQSGGNFRKLPELKTGENSAESRGVALQQKLGLPSLAAMRQLDAHELLQGDDGRSYRAIVDGKFIPDQLYRMFELGKFNRVPVMLGYNAEEGTTLGALRMMPKNVQDYEASLQRRFGREVKEVLRLYPSDDVRKSVLALSSDAGFGWNMHYWAEKSVLHGAATFMYYFTHQPLGRELGAFHAAEIVYVFNNASHASGFDSEPSVQLANAMADYWVRFATFGNPNGAELGAWPNYSINAKEYREFGSAGGRSAKGLMLDSYPVFERLYRQER